MSTAAIVKACVILMGIGIMIVTFVLPVSYTHLRAHET